MQTLQDYKNTKSDAKNEDKFNKSHNSANIDLRELLLDDNKYS